MTFGSRLRYLRLDRGLTQRELAEPRFSAAFVSTIETDKRRPSRRAVEHFAGKLGVEAEELVTGIPRGEQARLRARLFDARAAVGRGELDAARVALEAIAATATEHGWTAEEADVLVTRGLISEQLAEFADGLELFDRAQDLLRRESPLREVDAVVGRARCHQLLGDVHYSIHILETHHRVLREAELEDPSSLARLHSSLVAAYFDAGLMRQAHESARIALDLAPASSDPDRVANMHINVARVLLHQGRFDEARRSFDKAEELYRDLDWRNDLGRVHLARGFGLLAERRPGDAKSHLDVARGIFIQTGSVLNEVRSALQLACAHRMLDEADRALDILASIDMARRAGVSEQGIAWREQGLCHVAQGRTSDGVDCLRTALGLFENAQDVNESAYTYRLLGDLMRDQDELATACEAYRSAALALEHVA